MKITKYRAFLCACVAALMALFCIANTAEKDMVIVPQGGIVSTSLVRVVANNSTTGSVTTTVGTIGNVILQTGYWSMRTQPTAADGTGTTLQANNAAAYNGQAAFSASAATNANWCMYVAMVPEDMDTTVDPVVKRFKFKLSSSGDTAAHTYSIGYKDIANSTDSSIGLQTACTTYAAMPFAGDGSGGANDMEEISNITLTGFAAGMTPGHMVYFFIARDGGDASSQASISFALELTYTRKPF